MQNADRVLHPLGQFFCFLGMRSWPPASAGLLRFLPHEESWSSFESLLLVLPSSGAFCFVVAAVSSEIANKATETAVTADVNSATVARHLLIFLPEGYCPGDFPRCLSCQCFAFLALVIFAMTICTYVGKMGNHIL